MNTDAVDIDVDVAAVVEAGEVKQNKTKKAQQEQEKQQERQKKKKTTVSTVPAAATQTTNSSSATTITTTGTSTSTSTSTTTTVGKKRKTEVPPLKTYQVDPDSGLIGCICGIEDDDGFTIQCDICFRWQHCVCMGYENGDEVPEDEYKCYYCDSEKWGKFDPLVAREKTLARLDNERIEQEEKSNETVDEIEHKSDMKKEILESGTVSAPHSISSLAANQEHVPIPPPNNKRKQLNSDKGEKKRKTDDKGNGRKSPPTVPTTPTQTAIATSGAINNTSSLVTAEHKVKFDEEAPNKNNELLEDGVTAETYQSVYYKLKENDFKRNSVKSFIVDAGVEFVNSLTELPKLEQQQLQQHQKRVSTFRGVQIMSPGQFKAIKLSRIVLPKYQKYLQDHNKLGGKKKNFNKTKVEVKPYTDNSKHKFNGISKLSLFITTTDGALVIPENTPIIEYLGEIDFFKDYCNDSINQYSLWGTTKPKVLKASIPGKEKSIDIVLDSRFVGNESRFIRKSCLSSANCKIQTIYIPELKKFKFLVVTSRPITLKAENADEELRLPWDWDSQHPILKLYENNSLEKFENLTNEEKSALITYVDNYLHFVECGCSTHSNYNNCAIFKIKKATSYLMRSTRKASSISNINLGKSKDELVLPRPDKKYVSWDERMAERDQQLQKELLEQKSVSKESENESDANIVLAELDGKDKNTEKEAAREEVIKKPIYPFKRLYKQKMILKAKKEALLNSKNVIIGKDIDDIEMKDVERVKEQTDDGKDEEEEEEEEEAGGGEKENISGFIPIPIVPQLLSKIEAELEITLLILRKPLAPVVSTDIGIDKIGVDKLPGLPHEFNAKANRTSISRRGSSTKLGDDSVVSTTPRSEITASVAPTSTAAFGASSAAVPTSISTNTNPTTIASTPSSSSVVSATSSVLPQDKPKPVKKLSFADYKKKMK